MIFEEHNQNIHENWTSCCCEAGQVLIWTSCNDTIEYTYWEHVGNEAKGMNNIRSEKKKHYVQHEENDSASEGKSRKRKVPQ